MTPELTPDRLRDVAWTLDMLTMLMPDPEQWKINGEPIPEEHAAILRDWLQGTTMQDDLRRWANEMGS
jgi:capsular polysaccharide biosynthesis protein